MLYQPMVPGVEVNGATVLAIVRGMESYQQKAFEILARHGITYPSTEKWYPQQLWLNCFKEIAEFIGPNTLFVIGLRIPECAKFPPGITTIEKGLESIDIAYHMNHRLNGIPMYDPHSGKLTEGIGHYKYVRMGDGMAKMVCDNPYPCEFDRGIIEAVAKAHKPPGSLGVTVLHDDSAGCRKQGSDSCTYVVRW